MLAKKLIIASLFITLIAGCKRVLEIKPESTLDGSERFKEIADYQYALVGAYRLFQSTNYYGATDGSSNAFVTLPDILSDNTNETAESLGNERVFSRWAYTEDENQIENTWTAAYRIISQANLTMRGIDAFAATDAEAVKRIKGQALAIRSLVHFDLMRYWVEDYDRNSGKPGIPFISRYDYEQKPSRGTVKQTYDSITRDLKQAKALLAGIDDINGTNSSGEYIERAYIDEHVVNAILARMYLYANQLDSAIHFASLVINEFPLADINEFPDIWTDASVSEVIWSVTFDAGQGTPGANMYAPDVNRSQYRPNLTLRNTYDQNNDVRYNSYFGIIAHNSGALRVVLTKYLAKLSRQLNPDGVVNFKAFRTGEMYLIRAEAYARQGTAALANDDLNELRSARIFGYSAGPDLTGAALLSAIELERRKELVAEGHRFFDLKRTTKTVNRPNCTDGFCTLLPADREWTWPIPLPEIDANPGILPQNTGY
jgi:starch-binding outer membrane protein, SusD/RagB family